MKQNTYFGLKLFDGTAPPSSYWAEPGLSRDQLRAVIAARKAKQATVTLKDVRYDPGIAATVSLMEARACAKAGRERR